MAEARAVELGDEQAPRPRVGVDVVRVGGIRVLAVARVRRHEPGAGAGSGRALPTK